MTQRAFQRLAMIGALGFVLGSVACKKPAGDAADEGTQGEAGASSEGDDRADAPAGQQGADEHFTVVTSVDAASDELRLSVVPAEGYKINVDFPWLLALEEAPAGVNPDLRKDAATEFGEARARFTLDGSDFAEMDAVRATLRFSVCNDDVCLTPTRELSWAPGGTN